MKYNIISSTSITPSGALTVQFEKNKNGVFNSESRVANELRKRKLPLPAAALIEYKEEVNSNIWGIPGAGD